MREIKFRKPFYKDGEFTRFAYWGLFPDSFTAIETGEGDRPHEQFIGIQDSEGNDIYEGDIISINGAGRYEVHFDENKCAFVLSGIAKSIDFHVPWVKNGVLLIIGNIHQNKELIK